MKTLFFSTVLTVLSTFFLEDKLVGRWETKPSPKGNVTGVLFKPDHTYMGYVNGKPFVTGVYILQDSIVTIKEPHCDKKGVYKLIFFSNGDSLRFQLVGDSCTERSQGMVRTVL